MDLRQMEVVVAVAEEGEFTPAAQRLHVVQSAVSSTVRALERGARDPAVRPHHAPGVADSGGRGLPTAARATLRAAEQARWRSTPPGDSCADG